MDKQKIRTGIVLENARGRDVIGAEELLAGEKRVLFCEGTIDYPMVMELVEKIIYLDSISHEPITLVISSQGGRVDAGLVLYDVIQIVQSPVRTIGVMAYSMGAFLLASGTKGERWVLPHTRVMLHEPKLSQGAAGSASNIRDLANDMLKTKKMLDEIISKHTGKSLEEVEENTSYEHFFTAEQALDFGLIDGILKKGEDVYA